MHGYAYCDTHAVCGFPFAVRHIEFGFGPDRRDAHHAYPQTWCKLLNELVGFIQDTYRMCINRADLHKAGMIFRQDIHY